MVGRRAGHPNKLQAPHTCSKPRVLGGMEMPSSSLAGPPNCCLSPRAQLAGPLPHFSNTPSPLACPSLEQLGEKSLDEGRGR